MKDKPIEIDSSTTINDLSVFPPAIREAFEMLYKSVKKSNDKKKDEPSCE